MGLTSGETLMGDLQFDPELDLIKLKLNEQILSFSAQKVNYFKYYDDLNKYLRTYYSVNDEKGNFRSLAFYEQIVAGKITLFNEHVEVPLQSAMKDNLAYYKIPGQEYKVAADQFFLWKEGQLIKYRKLSDFLNLVQDQKEIMEELIKKENLNLHFRSDMIRAVLVYNGL